MKMILTEALKLIGNESNEIRMVTESRIVPDPRESGYYEVSILEVKNTRIEIADSTVIYDSATRLLCIKNVVSGFDIGTVFIHCDTWNVVQLNVNNRYKYHIHEYWISLLGMIDQKFLLIVYQDLYIINISNYPKISFKSKPLQKPKLINRSANELQKAYADFNIHKNESEEGELIYQQLIKPAGVAKPLIETLHNSRVALMNYIMFGEDNKEDYEYNKFVLAQSLFIKNSELNSVNQNPEILIGFLVWWLKFEPNEIVRSHLYGCLVEHTTLNDAIHGLSSVVFRDKTSLEAIFSHIENPTNTNDTSFLMPVIEKTIS